MGQKNLPLASGDNHAQAFEHAGWTRRKTGNHILLTKPGVNWTVCIPNHGEVKRALLQKQIRGAGLTEAEYLDHFANR